TGTHIYSFQVVSSGNGTALYGLANGLAGQISGAPGNTYVATPLAVTQVKAGFGTPVLYSNLDNHALFDAQTLDFASWGNGSNSDFGDNGLAPHLTVKGVGTGDLDYYSFKVDQTWIDAGGVDSLGHHYVNGVFDVDHGFSYLDHTIWGSQLRLYQTQS